MDHLYLQRQPMVRGAAARLAVRWLPLCTETEAECSTASVCVLRDRCMNDRHVFLVAVPLSGGRGCGQANTVFRSS